MSSDMKNLILLGALLVKSSTADDWPEAIRKVYNEAYKECTSTLDDEQFKLYRKVGGIDIAPVAGHDDG